MIRQGVDYSESCSAILRPPAALREELGMLRTGRMADPRAHRLTRAALSLFLLLLGVTGNLGAAQTSAIEGISISRPFFNPSLNQQVNLFFTLLQPGQLTVLVLDRDGYVIRQLAQKIPVPAGTKTIPWDGHDDHGVVVPDEAYSFKIDLAAGAGTSTYFPANTAAKDFPVTTQYYDRRSAILSYRLPSPARVHIQAGTARINPDKEITAGPVLKTIVNREPRPAGAVIENWNGMDESGTTYVPDLNHFAIAIAATSLPENTIITSGNRSSSFLHWAAERTGTALLTQATTDHRHHKGLTTLDDAAPRLEARVDSATWSSRMRTWTMTGKTLKLSLALKGPSAASFAKHPSKLAVFFDERLVTEVTKPKTPMTLSVPLGDAKPGHHVAALNWASLYGPVAVQTIPIQIGRDQTVRTAGVEGIQR
jgi:hypothetical protein